MTQRERTMLYVLLGMGGIGLVLGGVIGLGSVRESFALQDAQIMALNRDVTKSRQQLKDLVTTQTKLNQWRDVSLPPDAAVAGPRYKAFLQDLSRKHQLNVRQLTEGGLRSAGGRNATQISPLSYSLSAEGTLPRLLGFLGDFYHLNLPHVVREMTLTPQAGSDGRMEIALRIEVLSLPNATNRDFLIAVPNLVAVDVISALSHGPVGVALAPWLMSPTGPYGSQKLANLDHPDRDYARMINKNVFQGLMAKRAEVARVDRDILKHVQLTSITENFIAVEATLRNRMTNKSLRLRAEGGYDSFEIKDADDHVVLKGKVKQIENRSLVFETDEKLYCIRMGQFLHQALQKELKEADLKALGVGTAAATGKP